MVSRGDDNSGPPRVYINQKTTEYKRRNKGSY